MPEGPSTVEQAFENLNAFLKTEDGIEVAKKVKALVAFNVQGKSFGVDMREGADLEVKEGPVEDSDCTLTLGSASDFLKLVSGQSNPQMAFMMGKLKIKGPMSIALKLQPVLNGASGSGRNSKAKL